MSYWLVLILSCLVSVGASPVSNPHVHDGNLDKLVPDYMDSRKTTKRYHEQVLKEVNNATYVSLHGKIKESSHSRASSQHWCAVGLRLKWAAETGSSIFSPPVIYPSGSQGKKQIFVNTFYQFLEVIGFDGFRPWGWPLSFEGSSFQGSPVIHDIDEDGVNDIGSVDKDGNLYWVRVGEFGQYLEDFHVKIPKLKVQKDWATKVSPDYQDKQVLLTMFDHGKRGGNMHHTYGGDDAIGGQADIESAPGAKPDALSLGQQQGVSQASYPELGADSVGGARDNRHMGGGGGASKLREATTSKRSLNSNPDINTGGGGSHRRRLQSQEEESSEEAQENPSGGDDGDDEVETPPLMPTDDIALPEHYLYGAGIPYADDGGRMFYGGAEAYNDTLFAFVDAHVLGSPTLADVNNDGHMEVIMAVSYYFDKALYAGREAAGELDFVPGDYVAGGVVAWDVEQQRWAWTVHLDLTTDKTKFKALIHGSPTVADLDGDGQSEVIIGTSMGLLYVLDGTSGFVRRFFPMQFHEIQASVAVADIVGGGNLEMIVADMAGNVVVVDVHGEVLWDAEVSGSIPFTPTVGDVNGDGRLDVVVVTNTVKGDRTTSYLWALDGQTGKALKNYPLVLPEHAAASSAALLVDLHDYYKGMAMTPTRYADPSLPPWMQATRGHQPAPAPSLNVYNLSTSGGKGSEESGLDSATTSGEPAGQKLRSTSGGGEESAGGPQIMDRPKGLHLVVPAFDGHLYVIDGRKGCAERVDLGQHVYSMPLADDVTGDGLLDIVVGTMNGEIILLETEVPYHALNAWSSFPKHRMNGFTHGVTGISVPLLEKRRLRNAAVTASRTVSVTFDIWDARHHLGPGERAYTVTFSRGTSRLVPLLTRKYTSPGRYTVQLPVAPPDSLTLLLGMTNEHNQYFEESIPLTVGTGYYVWIKYLVLTPLALFVIPLHLMRGDKK